jgi:hypothetical protein
MIDASMTIVHLIGVNTIIIAILDAPKHAEWMIVLRTFATDIASSMALDHQDHLR